VSLVKVDAFIPSVSDKFFGAFYANAGSIYFLFPMYWVLLFFLTFFFLFSSIRHSEGEDRKNYLLTFWGVLIGFLGGSTTFPQVYDFGPFPYGVLAIITFVLFIFYAGVKYGFSDAKIVISKAGAQFLAFVLYLSSFVMVYVLTLQLNVPSEIPFILLGVVWIYVFPFFRLRLQTYVNRKFLKGVYSVDEILSSLSSQLVYAKDVSSVMDIITTEFVENLDLKSAYSLTYSFDEQDCYTLRKTNQDGELLSLPSDDALIEQLKKCEPCLISDLPKEAYNEITNYPFYDNSLVLPIHSLKQLVGVFILSPKLSGDSFYSSDIKLLSTITNQVLVVFDRIAFQKKLEYANEQLKDMNKSLEDRVQKQISQIKDAETMAQKASAQNTMSQLTLGIAHEINNPLAVMLANAEYVEDELDDKIEVSSFISMVKESIVRITNITETMLRYGKAESVEKTELDVQELLEDVVLMINGQCKKQGVVVKSLFNHTRKLHGDVNRLNQVVLNLSLNAIQAMADGGELIFSSWDDSFRSKGGTLIEGLIISIKDTGIGMSKETIEKVFDPFFTQKAPTGGVNVGLGLSIALRVIEDHGGILKVKSEEGSGTEFLVCLPGFKR
jgi:signal transduction histidine kinase